MMLGAGFLMLDIRCWILDASGYAFQASPDKRYCMTRLQQGKTNFFVVSFFPTFVIKRLIYSTIKQDLATFHQSLIINQQ